MCFKLYVALLAFVPCHLIFAADKKAECSKIIQRINDDEFNSQRGLFVYTQLFRYKFIEALKNSGRESTWIDMGAGTGRAQLEYSFHGFSPSDMYSFRSEFSDFDKWNLPPVSDRANTLAIGFKRSQVDLDAQFHMHDILAQSQKPSSRFSYLEGKYVEELSTDSLPKAKVISDLLGPLSYTVNFDVVLNKYLDLLEAGGQLFVAEQLDRTKIKVGRSEFSLLQWLGSIPGIEVEHIKDTPIPRTQGGKIRSLVIRKNSASTVLVPRLELDFAEDASPPFRTFKQIH